MSRGLEARVQTGERPGEAADLVGHQAVAEARVGVWCLVALKEVSAPPRREPLERPLRHRLAAQRLQALVDAAHAAALAACEHHARNCAHGSRFYGVSFVP